MAIEGLDDWVPIDRLIYLVKEVEKTLAENFREAVLSACALLLDRGLMEVGEIGDDGFDSWPGRSREIIDRIATELDRVNWMPFGGSCWLANTPYGDGQARDWKIS
ncbi:hypothetical protein [Actinocorallia sp. A-T 12471]|uniref:hypothetical protein n=1 Tax=Actinocorallia sp. A-T 12471 TaxID=3089813 RepID=UPI0029CC9316|nr:hypothetical protein [Actinocorallia sp. A-T 12471]MDX6740109.1 hypothetical protein [Actinocorallia sp. A-T 12471]